MVAAAERVEDAGNAEYHDGHMGTIFKKGFSFSGYERDMLKWNLGDRFLDISGVSGVDSISDGRGTCFADFDNDGDTDVFLTAEQGEAHFLFRNNVGNQQHYLRVELVGDASGKDAFGTVVRMQSKVGQQTKLKSGGSGYLSQSDQRLLFGLGESAHARSVEVVWPDGQVQTLGDIAANQTIRVTEGRDGFEVTDLPSFNLVDPPTAEQRALASLGFRLQERFPDLALADLDGNAATLDGLVRPGRKLLVNLWATWCVPCSKEIPELQKLSGRLGQSGVDLVGISVDSPETVGQVPGYIASRSVDYPIFTTDVAGLDQLFPLGELTVPMTVLLDENGRVLRVFRGWSHKTETEVLALTN
ncbi:MAG: ASPIC/UnbV domain-containing protein [Acidobacteriota bacterium]|nr:ASPIC/UnbV domain-containing protein [Acidobacteriota bacterium]